MGAEHTDIIMVPDTLDGDLAKAVPLIPSRSLSGFPEPSVPIGTGEEAYLYFHIDPKHTNYVNRILEGYEYVGVMTSVDKSGRCMVRCTPDTRSLAIEILSRLPEVTLEI